MSDAPPPHIELLLAMQTDIEQLDFGSIVGVPNITFRHARNRVSPGMERPSISLRWNGNSDIPDAPYKNDFERQMTMDCDLIIDVDLPPEDSRKDVTGWLGSSLVAIACVNALRAVGSETERRTDWVQQGDLGPDDDESGPDNARLVQPLTVLYRVLTDDPSTLLWQETDGG